MTNRRRPLNHGHRRFPGVPRGFSPSLMRHLSRRDALGFPLGLMDLLTAAHRSDTAICMAADRDDDLCPQRPEPQSAGDPRAADLWPCQARRCRELCAQTAGQFGLAGRLPPVQPRGRADRLHPRGARQKRRRASSSMPAAIRTPRSRCMTPWWRSEIPPSKCISAISTPATNSAGIPTPRGPHSHRSAASASTATGSRSTASPPCSASSDAPDACARFTQKPDRDMARQPERRQRPRSSESRRQRSLFASSRCCSTRPA